MGRQKKTIENEIAASIETKRSSRSYFNDLKKLPVLDGDEQIKLAVMAISGDRRAFNRLIESNLRFVVSIAKEYSSTNIPIEDLISEGNIGLMEAVNRFDESKGFKFISYAVWWVRQSIIKSINDNRSNIRMPVNKINALHKITKAREFLFSRLERIPTDDEIIEYDPEITINDMKSFHLDTNFEHSIDEKLSNSENSTLESVISNDDFDNMEASIHNSYLHQEINKCLTKLSDREARVIRSHFGIYPYKQITLKEIGLELGLTNERVRQILKSALRKMRSYDSIINFQEFTDDIQ
jgi:RNA polymerase primary sigma factor